MGITVNHAQSFQNVSLPIGQMYHVAIDNQYPYWIYSNRQDDGTMRGPSNSPVPVTNVPIPTYMPPAAGAAGGRGGRGGGGEGGGGRGGGSGSAWQAGIGGCESGFTLPGPEQPRHHLGELLRRPGDTLRQPSWARALGQPMDPHARLGAQQAQVPRALDPAPGNRSIRQQYRLFRHAVRPQDVQRGPDLGRDQS